MTARTSVVLVTVLVVACSKASAPPAAGQLRWRTDDVAACAEAKAAGKPVLVHFTAEWCGRCKQIEQRVYADPTVEAALAARFIAVSVDVTRDDDAGRAAKDRWNQADVVPTIILATPRCEVVERFVDLPSAEDFRRALDRVR